MTKPRKTPRILPTASYESSMDYTRTVKFVRDVAREKDYFIESGIVVFRIDEDVFIRSNNAEWYEFFEALCEISDESIRFYRMHREKMDEITGEELKADESFGDPSLLSWKAPG